MSQTENSEEIYYHYTSVPAFYNIIASKSLWLTSLKTSNDKTELFYEYKFFEEDFKKAVEKLKPQYQSTLLNTLELEKDILLELENFQSQPFGLSFTTEADNLLHWSMYGDNSKGIALAISKNEFINAVFDKEKFTYALFSLPWTEVRYTDEERQNCIYTIINNSLSIYEQQYLKFNNPFSFYPIPFTIDLARSFIRLTFHILKKFCKNKKFKDEKEARIFWEQSFEKYYEIIFSYNRNSVQEYRLLIEECNKIKKYCKLPDEEEFHVFGNVIKPYLPLDLSYCWNSKLIPKIIIGPFCPQNDKNLQLFLNKHELHKTEIIKSEVPLR